MGQAPRELDGDVQYPVKTAPLVQPPVVDPVPRVTGTDGSAPRGLAGQRPAPDDAVLADSDRRLAGVGEPGGRHIAGVIEAAEGAQAPHPGHCGGDGAGGGGKLPVRERERVGTLGAAALAGTGEPGDQVAVACDEAVTPEALAKALSSCRRLR
jgi:hypothetical protein